VAAVLAARPAPAQETAPQQPNILLIMADDLGYECLGSSGGTSYRTPHLDELARTGMRFEHCYSQPLCSPSRLKIMTGRYNFRSYKGWGILDPKERTFGHLLREAGYATCVSGKWQLCHFDQPENAHHPKKAGFDEFCVWTWQFRKRRPARYWNPFIWQDGKLREDLSGRYGPDVHCEFVIDFIRRNKSRPFLAYYTTNLVHAPFLPTPDSKAKPAVARKKAGGKGKKGSRSNYAAMVAYLDKCVGRVVHTLDELKLREKTLILFTADNGTPRGITSMMGQLAVPGGKGSLKDAGIHVPLLANWKGTVPAGRVCGDPVDFSDFLPTVVELAGAKLPDRVKIDGRSFAPQLRGEPGNPRAWVFVQRLVRDQRWKLYTNGELFDMQADPFEKRPLASDDGNPQARAARKRLQAVLDSLKQGP